MTLRNPPVTNGGLLEIHLGAGQQTVVDRTFAANADLWLQVLTSILRSVRRLPERSQCRFFSRCAIRGYAGLLMVEYHKSSPSVSPYRATHCKRNALRHVHRMACSNWIMVFLVRRGKAPVAHPPATTADFSMRTCSRSWKDCPIPDSLEDPLPAHQTHTRWLLADQYRHIVGAL